IGGFIRDYLLGKESKDLDLLIDPFYLEFLENLSHVLKGKIIILDEERKYFRLSIKRNGTIFNLDFTPIYQGNLLLEISRRDFTINSILLDLQSFTLLDPLKGLKDLEENILRLSSSTSLEEDPLRILRVFRFSASGFKIDEKIFKSIITNKEKLKKVKSERIHEEIYKILQKPFTSNLWKKMEEIGILEVIFPELSSLKSIPWSEPHHENPLEHSISTLYVLEILYYNLSFLFPKVKRDLENYLADKIYSEFTKRETLKLTALLHDIGKTKTYSIDENNLVHYYGHSLEGANMVKNIWERLKLSNKELNYMQKLIKNHMYLIDFIKNPDINPIYKLIARVDEDVPSLILLFISDQIAIRKEIENREYFEKLITEYFKIKNIP
ncbi:MAG: HD domain-containing protein, partial [Dictyoglomus sp.]